MILILATFSISFFYKFTYIKTFCEFIYLYLWLRWLIFTYTLFQTIQSIPCFKYASRASVNICFTEYFKIIFNIFR